MFETGLQLQNTAADNIVQGGAVLFNKILVNADPNITFNSADSSITFKQEGKYYVS